MASTNFLPRQHDFRAVQGDDIVLLPRFYEEIVLPSSGETLKGPPVDWTGYVAQAHLKVRREQRRATAMFTCTIPVQTGESRGVVRMSLSDGQSAKLPAGVPLFFDLQLTTGELTRTYLAGTLTLEAETTRA